MGIALTNPGAQGEHLTTQKLPDYYFPLLHFWYLVSLLFKKNERTYILDYDTFKTDNRLKLFELNFLLKKRVGGLLFGTGELFYKK